MSDEADRRRAYRELEERGQPVPGKYFGRRMPPMKQKETPKIKVIDTTKMKQLKLLKTGGKVDPLKGLAKMVSDFGKGKTGIKTVDMQKKKDAILTKRLKKIAKTSKVKAKPQTFDITPKPGSALSIQKETITMAKDGGSVRPIIKVDKDGRIRQTGKKRLKDGTISVQPEGGIKFIPNKKDGGLMEAIEKVKAKEMKEGGNVPKPKMRPKKDPFRADKTIILNEEFSKRVAKTNEEAMKKAKKMQEGGATSDSDRAMMMQILGEKASTMSDAERAMLRRLMGRTANISDVDRDRMNRMMGIATRMEDGGAVPKKFKGFSKLPEAVQEKMNPTLAKKFEAGGPVKMGSGGGVCRGMGAARAGGKFKLR